MSELSTMSSNNYNEPGSQFDQTTVKFTIGNAFNSFSHENDMGFNFAGGFISNSGGDEYRTAALRFNLGPLSISNNMFTGKRQWDANTNDWAKNPDGTYKEDYPYRMGTYEIGFGPFKMGVDYEGIRHVIQNRFAHDYLTNKSARKNPYRYKLGGPKEQSGPSLWFQRQDTKPRFYINFSSSGGTLW